MYVPGITQRIYPRKGGGGGGRGGGKSGGAASAGSGSSGGGRTTSSLSGSSPRSGSTVSTYNRGGGSKTTIPSGQPFAGRDAGGGTRDQVFGSRTYGSGYPDTYSAPGRGVGGLGFPFFFWPLAWGGGLGYGAAYLHTHEYGDPDNSSRPGGPMTTSAFVSASSNSTFHLLSDNTTVTDLIPAIVSNCTQFNLNANASSSSPSPYNSSDPFQPRPEQVIQYFRGSSVALTLDGYNDTTALQDNPSGPDVPIPAWVDGTLMDCLNQTIGLAAPLVDSGGSTSFGSAGSIVMGPFSAVWLLCLMMLVL